MTIKNGCALGCAAVLTLALGAAPAAARYGYFGYGYYYFPPYYHRHNVKHPHEAAEPVAKDPFGNMPKGPLQIFISLNQQKLHLYSDGVHVADTSIATGVPSLPTPTGVFSVIQKQVFHRSNIYSNAPMPFMQRITWSGVAMHEGEGIGHPASHGCIRMPRDFAVRLYHVTRLGVPVVIARAELKPADFANPHLFVHRQPPVAAAKLAATLPAAATASPAAPTLDPGPGIAPFGAPVAQPTELGLRVSNDGAAQPSAPVASDAAPPAVAAPETNIPAPVAKAAKGTPIAIFISRKEKKIYVRQDFQPLFDAPVTIADADRPLGTHVFTALDFVGDDHTTLRWDVVSLPGEPPPAPKRKAERESRYEEYMRGRRIHDDRDRTAESPSPQTPAQVLARIDIPQETIDRIAELIVPGSSLIVSDHGLGDETGEGTNFVVVTR